MGKRSGGHIPRTQAHGSDRFQSLTQPRGMWWAATAHPPPPPEHPRGQPQHTAPLPPPEHPRGQRQHTAPLPPPEHPRGQPQHTAPLLPPQSTHVGSNRPSTAAPAPPDRTRLPCGQCAPRPRCTAPVHTSAAPSPGTAGSCAAVVSAPAAPASASAASAEGTAAAACPVVGAGRLRCGAAAVRRARAAGPRPLPSCEALHNGGGALGAEPRQEWDVRRGGLQKVCVPTDHPRKMCLRWEKTNKNKTNIQDII